MEHHLYNTYAIQLTFSQNKVCIIQAYLLKIQGLTEEFEKKNVKERQFSSGLI